MKKPLLINFISRQTIDYLRGMKDITIYILESAWFSRGESDRQLEINQEFIQEIISRNITLINVANERDYYNIIKGAMK